MALILLELVTTIVKIFRLLGRLETIVFLFTVKFDQNMLDMNVCTVSCEWQSWFMYIYLTLT